MGTSLRKIIAVFAAVCFLHGSVLSEPLHAIADVPAAQPPALSSLSSVGNPLTIPQQLGRIVECSVDNNRDLVIHLQDLHCNPEAQRNIAEMLRFLDQRLGIDRIMVEGAPRGRVSTALLESIPGDIRKPALDRLLAGGLISGAEYYAATAAPAKLSGIEEWDVYRENRRLFRALTLERESFSADMRRISRRFASVKAHLLSGEASRVEKVLARQGTPAYYRRLEQLGRSLDVSVGDYPDLQRYIEVRRLAGRLHEKRASAQLRSLMMRLRETLPYAQYRRLTEQYAAGCNDEFYQALGRACPSLSDYPDLENLLNYHRLARDVNPVRLLSEERLFADALLARASRNTADRDLAALDGFLRRLDEGLKARLTPSDYALFLRDEAAVMPLMDGYLAAEDSAAIRRLMEGRSIQRYYGCTAQRDEIFAAAVSDAPPGPAVGRRVTVVVTGGFHQSLSERLRGKGMSFVSVLPAMSGGAVSGAYERIMAGRVTFSDIRTAALAPLLLSIGVEQGEVTPLLLVLESMVRACEQEGNLTAERFAAVINEWCGANTALLGGRIAAAVEGGDCVVRCFGSAVRFSIADGKLRDFQRLPVVPLTVTGTGAEDVIAQKAASERGFGTWLLEDLRSRPASAGINPSSPQEWREILDADPYLAARAGLELFKGARGNDGIAARLRRTLLNRRWRDFSAEIGDRAAAVLGVPAEKVRVEVVDAPELIQGSDRVFAAVEQLPGDGMAVYVTRDCLTQFKFRAIPKQFKPGIKDPAARRRAFAGLLGEYEARRFLEALDPSAAEPPAAASAENGLLREFLDAVPPLVMRTDDGSNVFVAVSRFDDGEISTRILDAESLRGRTVTLTHSLETADDIAETVFILSNARRYGARRIRLVTDTPPTDNGIESVIASLCDELVLREAGGARTVPFRKNGIAGIPGRHETGAIEALGPLRRKIKRPRHVDCVLYQHARMEDNARDAAMEIGADYDRVELDKSTDKPFEWTVHNLDKYRGKDIVVIHSVENNRDLAELWIMLAGLRRAGARSVHLFNTYEAYSRADKEFESGMGINALFLLRIIDRLVDTHMIANVHYGGVSGRLRISEGTVRGFQAIKPEKIGPHAWVSRSGIEIFNFNAFAQNAEKMFDALAREIRPENLQDELARHPLVLVGPDHGSSLYAREAAAILRRYVRKHYGIDADRSIYSGYLNKHRTGAEVTMDSGATVFDVNEAEVPAFDVSGSWVFVLDDETATGGTVLTAAYTLVQELGAQWQRVFAAVVHGKFSKGLGVFDNGWSVQEAATRGLPRPEKIDHKAKRMPLRRMVFASRSTYLPEQFPADQRVGLGRLITHGIEEVLGIAAGRPLRSSALSKARWGLANRFNSLSVNVFNSPQHWRDVILHNVVVKPAHDFTRKSSIYWFPTRFCPVGCKDCYFASSPGKPGMRNRDTTYDATGVTRLLNFMKAANAQQLTVAGGGDPALEMESVLRVIRKSSVETLIIVTSGYWGKNSGMARDMIARIYDALKETNDERSARGEARLTLFLRISIDQYHAEKLTIQPTLNIVEAFHGMYRQDPAFRDSGMHLYLKTLDNDPSFAELRAALEKQPGVSSVFGGRVRVPGLSNVNITGTFNYDDGLRILVRSVPLFYADPMVDMNEPDIVARNARIFREKNEEKCMLPDGRVIFGGWRAGDEVVGINWHMPYDGRVQVWGTTSPDNDSNLYEQDYDAILAQQLSDVISLAMLEKGTQHVARIVGEVNPNAVLRAEAINIPDWYATAGLEEAKTRLYVSLRLLQEYIREDRLSDAALAALPPEINAVLKLPREYLMGLYHASGYTILDEYFDNPERLRYVDEYGSYQQTPKTLLSRLTDLYRLVRNRHYDGLDDSAMVRHILNAPHLSRAQKEAFSRLVSPDALPARPAGETSRVPVRLYPRTVIILSGQHGAGKSTVAEHLSSRTGFEVFKKGSRLREIARQKGFADVAQYIEYLNVRGDDKQEVFGQLNGEMVKLMFRGGVIIDDNFAPYFIEILGPLLEKNGIRPVCINVTADLDKRAQRTSAAQRPGDGAMPDVATAAQKLDARDVSERNDYIREYDYDMDAHRYNLTLDSSRRSVRAVTEEIVRYLASSNLVQPSRQSRSLFRLLPRYGRISGPLRNALAVAIKQWRRLSHQFRRIGVPAAVAPASRPPDPSHPDGLTVSPENLPSIDRPALREMLSAA